MKAIKREDWYPNWERPYVDDEFREWILSFYDGFDKKKKYWRFELYKKHAAQLIESDEIEDYEHYEDQIAYIIKETNKCAANTLYGVNKYGWIKEGNDEDAGEIKFTAEESQEILAFIQDLDLSYILGKGRQIGATTFSTLSIINKINVKKNYFIKYIANSDEKGMEIFNDKIKDGFSLFASKYPWFASSILNDSTKMLRLGKKSTKGKVTGRNSKIQLNTPSKNAINGGSPQEVYVDEIGLIDNMSFSPMLNEGRPTQYMYNPKTKKLELKRKLYCWGTGGEMGKGGSQMESEFRAALEAFKNKDYSYGLVPIFFNWRARPGVTIEIYKAEKKRLYRKAEIEKDDSHIVQFHQAYPDTIDDVFMRNHKTFIPKDVIHAGMMRTINLNNSGKVKYGYFKPLYDYTVKYPETFKIPYKIIGATFVETSGISDPLTTCFIAGEPKKWLYRYFQGIDPINSETGKSKFSSVIWDKVDACDVSGVFYREQDYQLCYIQSILQRLYFGCGDPTSIEWLLENNIGDDMFNFADNLGFVKNNKPVPQMALPPYMRNKSAGKWWGISNKTHSSSAIFSYMKELSDAYHRNINAQWFFAQAKTFVEKDVSSASGQRETRWQAQNKEVDYDDYLFAITFAYIAATICNKNPREIKQETRSEKVRNKYVMVNGKLVLRKVNSKGEIIGYPDYR